MRISYNWLKSYVDVKTAPEKLADLLTMSGLSVESVEKKGGDYIFEIEVTSNRPDCLSVIGIAREVAAITDKRLRTPPVPKLSIKVSKYQSIKVRVEDAKLCPRYTARIITNVKVGESPAWLKMRIEAMGLRPVNNVVDITNFCLFETGEPLHAFDLDKISGGQVLIRRAKKGERIVTIDGAERILEDSDLVIRDASGPIAIAGIMGGLKTEVTTSTRNVLLEAAYFDPVSIRRTSRRLGLATESSYRFERKAILDNILYSSGRASYLISKIAGGQIGKLFDIGKKALGPRSVDLRYSRLNKILGVEVERPKVGKVLNSLGLKLKSSSKDKTKLEIPHSRIDLENEIDIIEEVARIYGYDKIPNTLPAIVEQPTRKTDEMIVEDKIRMILTGLGFNEIVTYGLLSKRLVSLSRMVEENCIQIKNPLSSEQEALRPSLISGMLNVMVWNMNRKAKDLKLFELGKIYTKDNANKFSEKRFLSIGITGQIHSGWNGRTRECLFADLAGAFEAILSELGIDSLSYRLKEARDGRFSSTACASIGIDDEVIGMAGEVSNGILNDFDVKDRGYFLEAGLERLIRKYSRLEKRFSELPRYPSIFRDISIVIDKNVMNKDLVFSMRDTAGSILKEISLVDRYVGRQIPDSKIGLTYRLEYRDINRTLEEKDISDIHNKILKALEEKFGARLR